MEKSATWGYMGTVGAWFTAVAGGFPTEDLATRLGHSIDAVRRAADGLGNIHRPRHVSIEWTEFDASGDEIGFHDDDETDVENWGDVIRCLQRLANDSAQGVIEALFIELDNEVELEDGPVWVRGAAELQFSIGNASDNARLEITVVYSTNIDIWLRHNIATSKLDHDNRALATKNHPRLSQTLSNLSSTLGAPMAIFSSDRYRDYITPQGFRQH